MGSHKELLVIDYDFVSKQGARAVTLPRTGHGNVYRASVC